MPESYKTPGVYIEERNAFSNSAVPVPTAVPAFIGYTEKAMRDKKDITNIPTKISNYGEYLQLFGGAPKITYSLEPNTDTVYELAVNEETRFFLFNSMKLFFANGGSACYIVSVGTYEDTKSKQHFSGEIEKDGVQHAVGITALKKYPEPTMLGVQRNYYTSTRRLKSLAT